MGEIIDRAAGSLLAKSVGAVRKMATRAGNVFAGGSMATAYEAATSSPLMPSVPDIGPFDAARFQPVMVRLARHLHRNDVWTKRLVELQCDLVVGSEIMPVSRYPELDDLFMRAARSFDSRGVHGFAGFVREDIYKSWCIDGEAFVRVKNRVSTSSRDGLTVPLAFQSLTSDYVPWTLDGAAPNGNPRRAGIEFAKGDTDHREAFWVYTQHPRNAGLGLQPGLETVRVPAREMMHFFLPPQVGSPRGEVPLAAALVRAIKVSTYEDAELRRKLTATLFSSFLETPLDAGADQGRFPTEDEIDEMLSQVSMEPGAVLRLPNGMKANMTSPADTPASYGPYMKYQLMALSAAAGIPPHEVTGDVEGLSDRTIKFLGLGTQRRVGIKRGQLAHQLFNPIRELFIDAAIAHGLWTPPAGRPLWDAYECDWQQDPIQVATLNQDLKVMMEAASQGFTTRGYVSQQYLGIQSKVVDRQQAKEAARAKALGLVYPTNESFDETTPVAARIAAEALDEEMHERDIVEAASSEAIVDKAA